MLIMKTEQTKFKHLLLFDSKKPTLQYIDFTL